MAEVFGAGAHIMAVDPESGAAGRCRDADRVAGWGRRTGQAGIHDLCRRVPCSGCLHRAGSRARRSTRWRSTPRLRVFFGTLFPWQTLARSDGKLNAGEAGAANPSPDRDMARSGRAVSLNYDGSGSVLAEVRPLKIRPNVSRCRRKWCRAPPIRFRPCCLWPAPSRWGADVRRRCRCSMDAGATT